MKSLFKGTSLLVALVLVAFTLPMQAQKFGYLNSAEILSELPDVKQADANLEALQKQLQKKGQSMVEKLQQEYGQVQRQIEAGDLSPKQQEEKAQELKEKEMEIAQFEQDMMKQIQDKRSELLEPIYAKVNDAIEAVAKENGYQFIFDKGVLLYYQDSQDVSSLVRAKLGL